MLTGGTEFNAHYKKIMYCPKKKKKKLKTLQHPFFIRLLQEQSLHLSSLLSLTGAAELGAPCQAWAGSSRVAASLADLPENVGDCFQA